MNRINCEEIDIIKYNQQDIAYKLIKRYFNKDRAQYTHIKNKQRNLLKDKTPITNRWNEYIDKLYSKEEKTDSLVVNLIDSF